jgi:UDP-3-O-[3-hydroxymyristoyl] glucosamine N-acyltransferase
MPPTAAAGAHAYTLAELATRSGAALEGDGTLKVTRVAPLDAAGPGAIAFLTSPKYRAALETTLASAVIVDPASAALTALPRLVHRNPYATYARVAAILHPRPAAAPGVHPSAVVAADARVAPSAAVGPHAVVGARAVIGERAEIGAGCVIGAGAALGDDVLLHPNVTVCDACVVGPRTILHSGAVIGADGFGNADDGGRWIKIPQIGRVVIGADVEIGANTTIDRGTLEDTVIEDDVRIDNQVQIGHNCRVGRHTAIAGCAGIAGSVNIGRNCLIGGAAMINGHITIGDGTLIGPATGVMSSITEPGIYSGSFPAIEHAAWKRLQIELRRLGTLSRRLKALERQAAGSAGTAGADREES